MRLLVGKGERIVWFKLESRHNEFLASDNSEEFRASRRAHIKEIDEIYNVVFSKLDCVEDDCAKDPDGGAASSGGLPRRSHKAKSRLFLKALSRDQRRTQPKMFAPTPSTLPLNNVGCERMNHPERDYIAIAIAVHTAFLNAEIGQDMFTAQSVGWISYSTETVVPTCCDSWKDRFTTHSRQIRVVSKMMISTSRCSSMLMFDCSLARTLKVNG